MSGLLPSESEAPPAASEDGRQQDDDGGLKVLWLDDDEADTLIGSLSSQTARSVLTAVHDEPQSASELADSVDTSLQNVRHHLGNLEDAGLVEVTETRYSVKGREMNVYGPVDDSLVVCVGKQEERSSFIDSLKRLVGAAVALVLGSLLVHFTIGTGVQNLAGPAGPRVPDSVGTTGSLLGTLSPSMAFLAGGLVVLAVLAVQHRRTLA
jgi:DNA-binding transcriptional ArsR family regulator